MDIVLQGKATATIVIPKYATPVEEHAAQELAKYIGIISGTRLPITNDHEPPRSAMLLIGGPKRNKVTAGLLSAEAFDALVPGPEGMLIKTYGDDTLVLAGSSGHPNEYDRGTLYAVYELLERFLGCSFVAYGCIGSPIGECIPSANSLSLQAVHYAKEKADLSYRTAIIQYDAFEENSLPGHPLNLQLLDWMSKNRMNCAMLMLTTYQELRRNGIYEEMVRRGFVLSVGHHDSGMFFLPPNGNEVFPEKYYQTHPEYYRLQQDGTRFYPESKWHEQLIFDMHNQDCIREIAKNISTWLADNPYVDIVNFWPNDGMAPQCVCAACAAHTKTYNYAYMCNEIAKLVGQEYPHVQIDLLVYQDIWEAPEHLALSPNVLIDISTWGPQLIRRMGTNDGSGLIGSNVEEVAMGWARHTNNLVYYDYYMTNFSSNQVYSPMADEIVKIYEHFNKTGYCKGSGTQLEAYNLWNYLFNFYVHGRKSYDNSLSFDTLLDNFVTIFGKGKHAIREYLSYIEDFCDGQAPNGNTSGVYFIKHVDKNKVYSLFEQAYAAQEEDGAEKDAIRLLRMAFRYSDLEVSDSGNDEIVYISTHFGSYWGELGQIGYGISTYAKPGVNSFVPDKWYQFAR